MKWSLQFIFLLLGTSAFAYVPATKSVFSSESFHAPASDLIQSSSDAANQVRVTYTGGLAREDATSIGYYFTDGNGNVSSLIDSSGNIKAKYRYDSFGNLLSKSGSLADANLIRFSGKEYHANSGLYYYGFRYYAPNLQRWMNEDPIGLFGGLNLHGFVGNDPINSVDPHGLKTGDRYDITTYIWPSLAELEGRNQLDQRAREMGYRDYTDALIQLDAHRGRDTCDIRTQQQMQQAVAATAGSAGELGRGYLETASQLAAAGVATKTVSAASRMGEVAEPGWLSKIWNGLFGKGTPKSAAPAERALGNTADDLAEQATKACPVGTGTASQGEWIFKAGTPDEVIDKAVADALTGLDDVTERFGTTFQWSNSHEGNLGWTSWRGNYISLFQDANVVVLMEEVHHAQTAATYGWLGEVGVPAWEAASRNRRLEEAWAAYAESIGLIRKTQ